MKQLALTNYAAGLHTILVYLTEIVSQIAQLRLHALVKQRNKRNEKSSMLLFQRQARQLAMYTLYLSMEL